MENIAKLYQLFESDEAMADLTAKQRLILDKVCELALTLLKKNKDYGDSAFMTPMLCEMIGPKNAILVRLGDKFARLQNLLKNYQTPENEAIEDTFLDIAGYCMLYLV